MSVTCYIPSSCGTSQNLGYYLFFHLLKYCVLVFWDLEESVFAGVDAESYNGKRINKLLCKWERLIRRWCA